MYIRKSLTNVLTAISSVLVLFTIALWQFYVFVALKYSNGTFDLQGGRLHLGLAIGIALFACMAGFFVFKVFFCDDQDNKLHVISWDDVQS